MTTIISILCLSSNGHVLADEGGGAPRLPTITIELDAEDESPIVELRMALQQQLGVEPPVLEFHQSANGENDDPGTALLVTESTASLASLPSGFAWCHASEVDHAEVPEAIRARAVRWLSESIGVSPIPALRAAWSRPGWLSRATDWLDQRLAEAGRTRTGPVEQMRLWGISILLRVATDRGPVWLKGAYPPFAAEPRITRVLAGRLPGTVPSVVATNDAEGWTLLDDFGGALVGDNRAGSVGTEAIATLASIQRGFGDDLGPLIDAGAAQRPIALLADALEQALEEPVGPKPWGQSEVRRSELVEQLRRAVERVDALGMAPSLVHGDFHPWNVADVDGRPLIFDWTDAAISHPLVDFATWVGWVKDPAERVSLFEPWVTAWSSSVPAPVLRGLYSEVLAVGAAYQVVSYVGIVRTLEPELGPQVSGGAVSFANLLNEAIGSGA